jgi:DNA-binding HxlR family transcriptional regulator
MEHMRKPSRSSASRANAFLVDAFRALGHRRRLMVYLHLASAGPPQGFAALLRDLRLPKSTLSQALGRLEHAGLVTREHHADRRATVHLDAKELLRLAKHFAGAYALHESARNSCGARTGR